MKEVLFKGRKIDSDDWLQGYLFNHWDRSFILCGVVDNIPNMIEVIPKTVGQYKGFVDKNGDKVFEKDICEFCNARGQYGIGIIGDDCIYWISGDIPYTASPLYYHKCSQDWEIIKNISDEDREQILSSFYIF